VFGPRVVNTAFDNGSPDSKELKPPDDHHDKHDQVEKCELQDDQEQVCHGNQEYDQG